MLCIISREAADNLVRNDGDDDDDEKRRDNHHNTHHGRNLQPIVMVPALHAIAVSSISITA